MLSAAADGDLAEVSRILDAGADAGASDEYGNTPLHEDKREGHVEVLALLREAEQQASLDTAEEVLGL